MTNRSKGQGLVEFALAFPLFVLLLFGLIDIGRAVFLANSLDNAAREGARLAAVNQDKPTIMNRAVGQAQLVTPSIGVNFYLPPTSPAVSPSVGCGIFDGAGHVVAPPAVGCVAVVDAVGQYRAITPVIANLVGSITFRAKSLASVEFSCPNPSSASFPFQTASSCPRQP